MRGRYYSSKMQAWADILATERDEKMRAAGRISLAGSGRPQKVFRREKRRHVLDQVMDVLRDWRLSPWENEASAIHGLRAALCLEGHGWRKANDEASALVAEAMTQIAPERPSWDQGQREYSVPDDYCNWCHSPMPEGSGRKRFCSTDCARAAIQWRDYETTYKDSTIGNAAYYVIRRSQRPVKPCKHCGAPFHPENKNSVFCSFKCMGLHKRTIAEKPCAACGTPFRPHKSNAGLYCSPACAAASGRRPHYEKTCAWCFTPFMAKTPIAACCSPVCTSYYGRAKRGKLKQATAQVVDHLFRQQGLRITGERMAA